MPSHIAIVHGWSGSSKSLHNLKSYLDTRGFPSVQIWLSDYVSLDDDVRFEDIGKRMHAVIGEALASGKLIAPFDLIVHSAGGLVAREWISRYYPDGANCPVKRLLMLAPANFGSKYAALGKSMIGRLAKGWNNWFQSGEQILRGLELASPYQWDLARRDILDPDGSVAGPYGQGKIWPFVIMGTRGHTKGLEAIINEDGADGTVRVAAANLNAIGATVDFSADAANPTFKAWGSRVAGAAIPFAVLPDRDHSSIIQPASHVAASDAINTQLGELIVQALNCKTDAEYAAIATQWDTISDETATFADDEAKIEGQFPKQGLTPQAFQQYFQLIVRARDDEGQPIKDFFLEFFSPEAASSKDFIYFHKHVLEDTHVNTTDASFQCLFVDRSDLMNGFYALFRQAQRRRLAMSVSAAPLGPNVRYFDSTKEGASGHILIHDEDPAKRGALDARIRRNTTHLLELILPRRPLERVFTLSQ